MNFGIPEDEIKTIYKNIIKDLNDRRERLKDNKQIDILAVIRKLIKENKNNCIIQFNKPSDTLEFNYAYINDLNEYKFVNNFLDLISKEFLLNRKYKITKKIKDIVIQEANLQEKIDNKDKKEKDRKEQVKESMLNIKVKKFEEENTRRRIDFNSSNSNNNSDNNSNNSNNNSNNQESENDSVGNESNKPKSNSKEKEINTKSVSIEKVLEMI